MFQVHVILTFGFLGVLKEEEKLNFKKWEHLWQALKPSPCFTGKLTEMTLNLQMTQNFGISA